MDEFILTDTNIVSYIFRQDTRAALYEPHLYGKIKVIAAQNYAELMLMPLLNSWSEKRSKKLSEFLQDFVFVEVNKRISQYWVQIQFEAKKKGRPISTADAWIAATALAYQIPLATHNPSDFQNISDLVIITEK